VSRHQAQGMDMWPIEDGHRVSNGVTSTAKDPGCSSVKVCLSLNGIVIMSCLC
jgi:hypothetical protein